MPIVAFRDVSYRVGGRPILNHFTLTLDAGETFVLLGRSGSGKTTALRMVNAMVLPTEGEVLVDDRPTTQWDPIALRRRIGYVIQDGGLFPHFTVGRNVGLVPRLLGWPQDKIDRRVTELLKLLGLPAEEFVARYPRELSGGQRQRVGVARALAAHQSLLLFDEPFGGLDPVTRLELQRQFIALRRDLGTRSLFVTHDVQEALFLGTHIAVMAQGAIEFVGAPHEFLAAPTAEARAFLDCLHAVEGHDGRQSPA